MKIYLVGMPGAGKSYAGAKLAHSLSLPFIDLDTEIEKTEGQAISTIFKEQGEAYFRQAEADLLRLLSLTQPSFVMATGGGAPCFHQNMELMNQHGTTVFLDTPLDEILERLLNEGIDKRPLLKNNPVSKVKSLYSDRITYYEMAKMKVKGFDLNEIEPLLIIHARK